MPSQPQSRSRKQLLRAALRLFATDGVEATSIRAVNRKAGLGPASVHYHFGNKDALIEAVLHLYGDEVIDEIVNEAELLSDSTSIPTADDVVSMVAQPYLHLISKHGKAGIEWIHTINQFLTTDSERVTSPAATEAAERVLNRAFPNAIPDALTRVHALSVRLLVSSLSQSGELLISKQSAVRSKAQQEFDTLLSFLAGGISTSLARIPSATPSGSNARNT